MAKFKKKKSSTGTWKTAEGKEIYVEDSKVVRRSDGLTMEDF